MARSHREHGTSGSILTDTLFNNKSMIFNINAHCDFAESILVQIPLIAYSNAGQSASLVKPNTKSLVPKPATPQSWRACRFIF